VRLRKPPVVGLALAGLAGFAVSALSAPTGALPTTTSKMSEKAVVHTYKVVNAKGKTVGSAKWRVTTAGGNCCEVLVMATRTGRLVEFGGTYPAFSDDQGKTWQEVAPLTPSTSRIPNPGPRKVGGGEGTIVQSPDGDILGIGWDPYSGDRLQSFMYHAKDKKWYYQEAPLHEPFYDREWVAVAKGPFTIAGQTVPWVSMVVSNFNRHIVLMSLDGLNYFTPTQRDLDAVRNGAVSSYLPTGKDPDLDYMQQHAQTGLGTLAKGILSFDAAQGCATQTLKSDGSWACFSLPNEVKLTGPLFTDSRGWVHEVVHEAGEFTYRMSKDGGRKWTKKVFTLPNDMVAETFDVKINGKLGVAVIATHAQKDDGAFQDVVFKLNVKTTTPALDKIYYVGNGDLKSTVGLDAASLISGASTRVDFTTVAILPNGKIAVSFADQKHQDPAVAILV
jgi:hypothetical protein